MKAVVYDNKAEKGVVDKSDQPKPVPGPNEVLIKVRAAAVNPVDYKLPSIPIVGRSCQGRPVGLDLAGVVEAVGSGVTALKEGDEVYGNTQKGVIAEYACAEVGKVAKKPTKASFEEAAALPTVGLTSLQCLVKGNVGQGSRVLVLGGSGGCGAMGVQMAKAMGAHVTSNCSTRNIETVKKHGADEVIDYTSQEIPAEPKFDCIYDTVTSPDSTDTNYQPLQTTHLKPDGEYVAINGFTKDWLKHFMPRWLCRSSLVLTNHSATDLERIAKWVDEGVVRPQVQEVLPFSAEGVIKSFDMLKGRRATGKLVFKISD